MRKKVGVLSGIMIMLTVLAILIGLNLLQQSNDSADVIGVTTQLYGLFFEQSTNLRGYLLSGDQSFLTELEDSRKLFRKTLEEAKASSNDADIKNVLTKFDADEKRWYDQVATPVIEIRKKVNTGQASLQELNERFLTVYYGNFLLAEFSIRKDSQDLVAIPTQKMEAIASQARIFLSAILAVELVVGMALSVAISRAIIRPVKRLQEAASVISSGDLTIDIEIAGSDEVGELAGSFREMTASLRALGSRVIVAATDVSSASQQIASSTEEMGDASQQVSSTIQQIARGAQTQAEKLDEANQIVSRLGSTMNELATSAKSAAEMSVLAGQAAEAGGKAASSAAERILRITKVSQDSAEKVKGLSERSAQITSVLEVIRKIADQTNLLALNAAIEAARAGEAGKGFGVVADEVRRLAEGSAKAAADIATLLKQVQEDAQATVISIETGAKEISEGRSVIDKALRSLEEISGNVTEVSRTVLNVATSIQNQVSAVEQLSKVASEVASVTEQNTTAVEEVSSVAENMAAGMEELTGASQHLATLSEQLQQAVSNFKLPAPEALPGARELAQEVSKREEAMAEETESVVNVKRAEPR